MRKYFLLYFDWINFFIIFSLVAIGVMFIFSATYTPEQPYSLFFKKQLVGAFLGIFVYLFLSFVDCRIFMNQGFVSYMIVVILLIYNIFVGRIAMGGRRWISLYFFRFQPSELVKFFYPFFIAEYLEIVIRDRYEFYTTIRQSFFIVPLGVLVVTFVLIWFQPDLATGLVIVMSGLITLWYAGLSRRFFIILFCALCGGSPLIWTSLRSYQKTRILVFLGYGDNKRERYQVEQSKIAIGSGGLWGKGFLQGTQNRLDFLPEDHSDFIFSIVCEEWGFAGAFIILMLFFVLFLRILGRIMHNIGYVEQVAAIGLITPIILSLFVNIGMVTGILPVAGIPLPLMSYGLSNLLVTLAGLGWVNNMTLSRYAMKETIKVERIYKE